MGAVLSTNPAPLTISSTPSTALLATTAQPPTFAAPLPPNDLRRHIKRKFEPLELASTTSPSGALPQPKLSDAKKRNLRAARHRFGLRLQLQATGAQLDALSSHTDKLDRLLAAVDRVAQSSCSPIPSSAGAPPPPYQTAAAPIASDPRPDMRRPGAVDAFLLDAAAGSLSPANAFGPLPDDHFLLRRHDPRASPAGQQRHPPHPRRAPTDGASPFPLASPSPRGPRQPSPRPNKRPAQLNTLGANVLLARRAWHDSFHYRPAPPRHRSPDYVPSRRAARHDRPVPPSPLPLRPLPDDSPQPDMGTPQPDVTAPHPAVPAPPEPRPPGNSLAAARQNWLSGPDMRPPAGFDKPFYPYPNPFAPRGPPGPGLAAARQRLQETVRLHYPDISLLDLYGLPQPPAAGTDATAPLPAPAPGTAPPAPSSLPGATTDPEATSHVDPLPPRPSDSPDPGTAAAPPAQDADEPPSLTPTEELLPGYHEACRHDSPRLDEIHPAPPAVDKEPSSTPVDRARPSGRLHLKRRPDTASPTIGSRLAGAKRRIRGLETDSAFGSSGSDSSPDRRSPPRAFRMSPPPSQRRPASSQPAHPARTTRSSARDPTRPKITWPSQPARRAAPGPDT